MILCCWSFDCFFHRKVDQLKVSKTIFDFGFISITATNFISNFSTITLLEKPGAVPLNVRQCATIENSEILLNLTQTYGIGSQKITIATAGNPSCTSISNNTVVIRNQGSDCTTNAETVYRLLFPPKFIFRENLQFFARSFSRKLGPIWSKQFQN